MQISLFEITLTLVGPYFNSQPLQCHRLLKHDRFSFHRRVKVAVCVWDRNGIDFIFEAQSERHSSDSQNMDSITWHFLYIWWKLCDHSQETAHFVILSVLHCCCPQLWAACSDIFETTHCWYFAVIIFIRYIWINSVLIFRCNYIHQIYMKQLSVDILL